MFGVRMTVSSTNRDAYEKIQKVVDDFVDELKREEPDLEFALERHFNPRMKGLPKSMQKIGKKKSPSLWTRYKIWFLNH